MTKQSWLRLNNGIASLRSQWRGFRNDVELSGIASAFSKPRNDEGFSNDVKLNGIASASSKPRNDGG